MRMLTSASENVIEREKVESTWLSRSFVAPQDPRG